MTASAALLAGSGILGAVGSMHQGRAAQDAANAEADVLNQRAISERQAGAVEAEDFERSFSRKLSAGVARSGASGVDISSGSPLLVTEASVREGVHQENKIRHASTVRAQRLDQQAGLSKQRGRFAKKAAKFGAFGSLLTGFSGLAGTNSSFFGSPKPSGPLNIIPANSNFGTRG